MIRYLDSSVLVAALIEDEAAHEECLRLLRGKDLVVWTHAVAETFATLTGGRLGIRVAPTVAATLIRDSIVPRLRLLELSGTDILDVINRAEAVGARGGAIYDLLHLSAARRASAASLYTLNVRHFSTFARSGDPNIEGVE